MNGRVPPRTCATGAVLAAMSSAGALVTLPPGASAGEVPPLYVDLRLAGHGTDHLTGSGSSLSCSGGDWQLQWRGDVPGETASPEALLRGDGMFYTDDEATPNSRPALQGGGIRCTSEIDGRATLAMQGTLRPSPEARATVQVSMAEGEQRVAIDASDLAVCRMEAPGAARTDLDVSLGLDSGGPSPIRFERPVTFSREELQRGFTKTFPLRGANAAPTGVACLGQTVQGEVTLRWKQGAEDVDVALDACLNLAAGETRTAVARGTPTGGEYQFRMDAPDLARVAVAGNQATVTAAKPGRGEFTAFYARGGRAATRAVNASVVDLRQINGGRPEVEVGLYAADGGPAPPLAVPFVVLPAGGGDLLSFAADSPGLVGLSPGSGSVTVQGVQPGFTTVRARTLCGSEVGPTFGVRVVPCTRETREKLETQKRALKERNDSIARRVTELLNDDEFERVEREIEEDTKNLAIKAAESIVGTLSARQGGRIDALKGVGGRAASLERFVLQTKQTPIEVASDIYDVYDTSMDALEGIEAWRNLRAGDATPDEAFDGLVKGTSAAMAYALRKFESVGLVKSYVEAGLAAQKMGQNLGSLLGIAERIEELDASRDELLREWERVARLIRRCDSATPPAGPEPAPTEPAPPRPRKPTTGDPAAPPVDDGPREAEMPPVDDRAVDRPPQVDGETPPGIVDPERKGTPRRSLPLCVPASNEPAAIAASLRTARDRYAAMRTALEQGRAAAERLADWPVRVQRALEAGPAGAAAALPTLRAELDASLYALAVAGEATADHLEAAQRCPAALGQIPRELRVGQP